MTAPEIIAYAAVLFIGIPSMLRNWTAVALVGSFLVIHFAWILTGTGSLALDIIADYAVVIAIFLKVEARDCSPFAIWGQFRGCWRELGRADKIVLALFAPAWTAYAIDISDWLRYWILWGAGMLQFAAAGVEAFAVWRGARGGKQLGAHPADPVLRWGLVGNEC
jgi:hypothetical protein